MEIYTVIWHYEHGSDTECEGSFHYPQEAANALSKAALNRALKLTAVDTGVDQVSDTSDMNGNTTTVWRDRAGNLTGFQVDYGFNGEVLKTTLPMQKGE